MAKQLGILQIRGKLGNLSFYRSRGKQVVRTTPAFDRQRFQKDPQLFRWRDNCAEFGRAGKAGKLLRAALQSHISHLNDNTVVTRLSTELLKVIKSDTINAPGLRNPADGNLGLLTGFDFNRHSPLATTMFPKLYSSWNRAAGTGTIIPETFIPAVHLKTPGGASHFKLSAIGINIDFNAQAFNVAVSTSAPFSCGGVQPQSIELIAELQRGSNHPSLLLLGIRFFNLDKQNKENLVPFRDGTMDVLTIISVNTV
jgi:hypothetical protein